MLFDEKKRRDENKMPKRGGRHTIPVYRLEERVCGYLKNANDWALKNSVLDVMSHVDSRVNTKSRILVNMFNPNQYKILNISAVFLSPFVTKHAKKVTWVKYKPNLDETECTGTFRKNLLPLFTSFALWDYLIDRPYQTVTASITQLHELFPQWTVDEWTTVIDKLNSFFKQINNSQSIRAEMKRIDTATSSAHYPWWKHEPTLISIQDDLREKLNHVTHIHSIRPQLSTLKPINCKVVPCYVKNFTLVTNSNCTNPNYTISNEVVDLSLLFYEYFRQQISMAEIQQTVISCKFDRDDIKRQLETLLKQYPTCDESFPENLQQLRYHFKHTLSNHQLFQIWKQSHGDWSIIQLMFS